MPSHRVIGLLASGAFAAAALLVPPYQRQADSGRYRASAVYQSALAEEFFSPPRLQALALGEEFARTVGGDLLVDRPPGLSRGVRLEASGGNEAQARAVLAKSVELLQREMVAEASEQLDTRIGYLRRSLEAVKPPEESAGPGGAPSVAIVEDEAHQALRVERQIGDLERYLAGGKLDPGLKALFGGATLRRLEAKLAAEQQQLQKLTRYYLSQRDILREQKALIRSMTLEVRALERYEAKSYLASLRQEQRALRESARAVIAHNRQSFEQQVARSRPHADEEKSGGLWLPNELAKLEKQREALAKEARLERVGALDILSVDPLSSKAAMALWLASLLALFWSLRDAPMRRRQSRSEALPEGPAKKDPLRQAALGVASFRLSEQIQQGLVGAMGRFPSRMLVLGADDTELRASLSLHLARGLRDTGHRVRLLDLDLKERYLSRQLADPSLPGLAELLRDGGPVEEFLCSVDGPGLQFAPAGHGAVVGVEAGHPAMARLTRVEAREVVLIDASFDSPLHLVLSNVDAVLCLSRFPEPWSARETEVLLALREARLTLWAVSTERPGFFPII